MNETILIVDDEEDIIITLEDSLINEGYRVLKAYNGDEAINLAKQQPDLVLLDIMMPGLNGYDVCQAIRDIIKCPIIFLSACMDEFDREKGFVLGGDDYVIKPFGMRELKARISAHLRRDKRNQNPDNKRCMKFNNLVIDTGARELRLDNQVISLTKREFDIIELLAFYPGQVFSKEYIYDRIWGNDAQGDSSTVTEFIKKIRLKFSEVNPSLSYISTVWGVGYKWEKS